MTVFKMKNYDAMSVKAAAEIAAMIVSKPDCVLGLATGSSPVGIYKTLVEWNKSGIVDFSRVNSVNLDEYKGLTGENEQSYRHFMNFNLFDHVNIDKKRTFVPDGSCADSEKACSEHEKIIASLGGIDLQLLGIGRNGHIGFNEPADSFAAKTHCVNLTESTIDANKRFFARAEDVPRQAYTMGIGTIMKAKKIVVVASGEDKADAVAGMLCGPVTPRLPASILQFHHNVVVVCDEAALSKTKCVK